MPRTQEPELPQRKDPAIVLIRADGKLDLRNVDIDKLNRPRSHPIFPTVEPPPEELADLAMLPVGTPHWERRVRDHLDYEEDLEIKKKEKEHKPWWPSMSFSSHKKIKKYVKKVRDQSPDPAPPTNIGLLDLDTADGNTDLERLVFSQSLPRIVQIDEDYSTPDCCLSLEKNKELMLHFSAPMYRVHATDPDGNELWMPVHSKLRFERLPIGEYET